MPSHAGKARPRPSNMRRSTWFVKRVNTIYCALLLGQSQDVDACAWLCIHSVRSSYNLVCGGKQVSSGGWRLEAGGWRLEAGGWRLGITNSQLEFVNCKLL